MITSKKFEGTEEICEYDSSNIRSSRYDVGKNRLIVEFYKGGKYQFDKIPIGLYTKFKKAKSQGVFFSQEIKHKYDTTKL